MRGQNKWRVWVGGTAVLACGGGDRAVMGGGGTASPCAEPLWGGGWGVGETAWGQTIAGWGAPSWGRSALRGGRHLGAGVRGGRHLGAEGG